MDILLLALILTVAPATKSPTRLDPLVVVGCCRSIVDRSPGMMVVSTIFAAAACSRSFSLISSRTLLYIASASDVYCLIRLGGAVL